MTRPPEDWTNGPPAPPFYNPALRWMAAFYPAYESPPVPPLARSEEDDDA